MHPGINADGQVVCTARSSAAASAEGLSPDQLQAAVGLLPVAVICIRAPVMDVSYVNAAACALLGLDAREIRGLPLRRILGSEYIAALADQLEGPAAGRPARATICATAYRRDGIAVTTRWDVSCASLDEQACWIAVITSPGDCDATQDVRLPIDAAVHECGRLGHDPLTGLPDRRLFERRLDRALRRAKDHRDYLFAVCFIDLDGFKTINDRLGHLAGDGVLREIACRLAGCIRPGDMAARYGGDEFTVLVDDLESPDDALLVADRVLKQLSVPLPIADDEACISASIGIAVSSSDGQRIEDLLASADRAMYHAKSLGGAKAVFAGGQVVFRSAKPR